MIEGELFAGPDSLRVRGERKALWGCVLLAPLTLALVSLMLPSVSLPEFVLLIVAGMVFVSTSRGRLLGSSVRVDGRQVPELADVAREIAARLGAPTPLIFIRDDPFVAIASAGIGEPYALILSSQYYEHLRRGELAFLIARELGHIAAGHTRLASLLSASGRENPVVALVFGAWLRRTEFTADRVGLLCCGKIDDARRAISISSFHAIGRRVDLQLLAQQRDDLVAEPTLRLGEWISSMPYATHRLDALREFDASPLAVRWRARLVSPSSVPRVEPDAPPGTVGRRDCASLGRRLAAVGIDLAVVAALLRTPLGLKVASKADLASLSGAPAFLRPLLHSGFAAAHGSNPLPAFTLFTLFVYSALLVGLTGQTLGMMIMELRVVTTRYGRPTPWQTVWRYSVAFVTSITVFVALIGFFVRVHPHDWLSKTRLVRGRKTT